MQLCMVFVRLMAASHGQYFMSCLDILSLSWPLLMARQLRTMQLNSMYHAARFMPSPILSTRMLAQSSVATFSSECAVLLTRLSSLCAGTVSSWVWAEHCRPHAVVLRLQHSLGCRGRLQPAVDIAASHARGNVSAEHGTGGATHGLGGLCHPQHPWSDGGRQCCHREE